MQMKKCSKCKQEFPIDMFNIHSKNKDGHNCMCKTCQKEYNRQYREKNKDKLREQSKQHRIANQEAIKAKKKEYYQEHKEEIALKGFEYRQAHKKEIAARDKKYAQEHKDQIQQYQKEYRESHKLSNAEYQKQYRIKNKEKLDEYKKSPHTRYQTYKKNAEYKNRNFDLSEEEFTEMTKRPCVYCGDYSDTYNGELFNGVDRVDSSLGYSMDNCVPCCATCNKMKLNLSVDSWMNKIQQIIAHYNQP